MVSTDIIRTIVGIIGNIISLGLFLSPVPTFSTIMRKRDVEQFSPMPYLATLCNCMLWVVYGLPIVHPHSTLVLTINGAGVVIELVYISLFLVFSGGKARLKVMAILVSEVAFVVAVAALVISFFHTTDKRSLIIGIVCIVFCIGMYCSPLSIMRMVIKTKSVEYMPFTLSFVAFLNGVCWTIYALLRFDPNILIPNGIGMVLAIAQLILYGIYYKSTHRQLAARKAMGKGEVGLSEVVIRGDNIKVASAPHNGHAAEIRDMP